MPIHPQFFPPLPNDAIASYDWQDLAEGTGIINYKLFTTTDSTGDDYRLGTQELYSTIIDTRIVATSAHTSFTKLADLDFDLSVYNIQKQIKGTMVLQFSHVAKSNPAVAQIEAYTVVRIRRWDGVAEHEVALGQTKTLTPGAGGGEESELVTMQIIIPKTDFAAEDALRVTIEMWIKAVGTGTPQGAYYLGHDPQNRDSTYADGIKPSADDLVQTFDIYTPYNIDK